jgi:hypothetical protein
MPRHLLVFACLLSLAAAAFVMGCSSGDYGGNATVTETLQTTATAVVTVPAETATPAPDIRQEDLTQQSGLREFLSSSGGQVNTGSIIYADLTGDGADEAVVPIASGGEGASIAVFVFGFRPGGLEELLRVAPKSGSLKENIVDGQLTLTEPTYAASDPFCCPSQLEITTYRWDGSHFVVANQRTEQGVNN